MEKWKNKGYEKKQNGKHKSKYINSNIKCKWIKQSNQKTVIVRLD